MTTPAARFKYETIDCHVSGTCFALTALQEKVNIETDPASTTHLALWLMQSNKEPEGISEHECATSNCLPIASSARSRFHPDGSQKHVTLIRNFGRAQTARTVACLTYKTK